MRLSVNQNNGNLGYMAKNNRRWNFFSKFLTQNHPKKYQVFTDDYFLAFQFLWAPLDTRMQQYLGTRACRLTRMQQYFGI